MKLFCFNETFFKTNTINKVFLCETDVIWGISAKFESTFWEQPQSHVNIYHKRVPVTFQFRDWMTGALSHDIVTRLFAIVIRKFVAIVHHIVLY